MTLKVKVNDHYESQESLKMQVWCLSFQLKSITRNRVDKPNFPRILSRNGQNYLDDQG